ncbi:uncharacterized protein LOC124911123 [Impatiens glandulifera]|uniref:uncharacterized protein LOC124911123 n=1 Tax=Impatiens glandulifera TaxID=253017 RepID=UPI001FB06483|nr:uncharacterized protein LOC124911123 [Impatiens glandulifera]
MAVSMFQKRMALRRKLLILRNLTNSKSVKKSSIMKDAFLHIYKLKMRVEAMKKEYLDLMQHFEEVKVEKMGEGLFGIRVTKCCKIKGKDSMMVSLLEGFEGIGVNVMQAKVSCNYFFHMEAILKPQSVSLLDVDHVKVITQAIHHAINSTHQI